MSFIKNQKKWTLILLVGAFAIAGIAIGTFFSRQQSRFIDPRISPIIEQYKKFNGFVAAGQYDSALVLLDDIQKNYRRYPHYQVSFEVGALYNHRTETYIAMALKPGIAPLSKDSLLNLAQIQANTSISLYAAWISTWGKLTEPEIRQKLSPYFSPHDEIFRKKNLERFINKRLSQITDEQAETPRRLSVAKTNLGVVLRHKDMHDDAVKSFEQALELWPDNPAARNNLNDII